LEIVKAYKAQIDSDLEFVKPNKLKLLSEVVCGDFITPLVLTKKQHSNWTIGKKYKVIDVKEFERYPGWKSLRVKCDKGHILPVKVYLLKGQYNGKSLDYYKMSHKWNVVS